VTSGIPNAFLGRASRPAFFCNASPLARLNYMDRRELDELRRLLGLLADEPGPDPMADRPTEAFREWCQENRVRPTGYLESRTSSPDEEAS